MISVIISSANPALLKQVSKNIEDTIAVPFEIIAFDNGKGEKGICEVYNQGIRQAKYDLLCFMHEDILIKTEGWGRIIQKKFTESPAYGLLGIAGSDYKTLSFSGWSASGATTDHGNFIQSHKFEKKEPFHYYKNPLQKEIAEVACVDGVWCCVPKSIATAILFDQDTFKGFHGYDLDFSLAVGRKYKVVVIFDVLIDHFSEGNHNRLWMEELLKLHEKWYSHLPVNVLPHPQSEAVEAEKATFKYFIDLLIRFKFPMSKAFEMLYKDGRFKQLFPALFVKMHFYILKKFIVGK